MSKLALITGADGQLGRELQRCSWPDGWQIAGLNRSLLDLTVAEAVRATLASQPWSVVINCAAYTAVDKAETDVPTAWAANALAPATMAQACAEANIPIVHLSTDYVFQGDLPGARDENDPVGPINVYGASKLGGELAVRTSRAPHAIVRTSWIVSPQGSNFVKTMLRLATERESLRVVDDQVGCPTSAADLARAIMTIAVQLATESRAPQGVFHFSNAGKTSWAGVAQEIFRQSASRGGPSADVEPISSDQYPTPARRPSSSLLSHERIQRAYGINPRPWQEALSEIMDELIGDKS